MSCRNLTPDQPGSEFTFMGESLSGKWVLITGASSGFGAASAEAFGKEGARLILGARRMARLETVAVAATRAGAKEALFHVLDVSNGIPEKVTRRGKRRFDLSLLRSGVIENTLAIAHVKPK